MRQKERRENFPVALRILPRATRRALQAVYDVVRVIDDLGDEADVDRTTALREFAEDLERAWADDLVPRSPEVRRLQEVLRERALPAEPFRRLIRANLQDQVVARYATFEDLLGYCRLSAEPVGRLVLAVFGQARPPTTELSDRVCTALQLVEHWQDVAEDRRRGRVYLPEEDLAGFGVALRELDAPASSPALRRLVRAETARAADLLAAGPPLVRELRGWARVAVAGYVAGGLATVDALLAADTDVLREVPHPRGRDVARHALALLTGRAR